MIELPDRVTDVESLRSQFRWRIGNSLNMAEMVCTRHVRSGLGTALVDADNGQEIGFLELERLASRMANLLQALGAERGDRIGVLLGQRVEVAALHIAAWKLGAVSLPLFQLFGPDALEYRLADSGARYLLTDSQGYAKIGNFLDRLPGLHSILLCDGESGQAIELEPALEKASDHFEAVATAPDDPAVLIYTSGTTGNPKGALHGHRVLAGHLPGVQMSHDLMPHKGDRLWTPADWAWIGGLFDVLMPGLALGLPVVMQPKGKFDPDKAVGLMAVRQVRNTFLPPTALRLMRQELHEDKARNTRLRSIASGGERLGDDVLAWAQGFFGVTVNEFYGQTECNMIVSNCAVLAKPRPGSMGVPVPGHEVAIVDEQGQPVEAREYGDIAVRRPDPAMFLGYWRKPEATSAKFRGDWLITGDRGFSDEDGFLTFFGREDDIISSSGYRIGPAEIEACLCSHESVAQAAVIGVADDVRGQTIQAHLVLRRGAQPSPELTRSIQDHVRSRLAAHEYPREIVYKNALPVTATGKIRRADLRQNG